MEYLYHYTDFFKVQERTKITKYLAPGTTNFKIPCTLRFVYLAQVVDQIRGILICRLIISDALSSE